MVDVVDIVNQGLRDGGVPLRVNDIYEGSEAARTALEIYSQCRDELLDAKDWSFARGITALTLLKGPPPDGGYSSSLPWSNIYPAPGFLYEYVYPSDCVNLRVIMQPPGLMPDTDPLPQLWRLDDDLTPNVGGSPPVASGPPQKVILCNVTDAMAVYRRRVTDPAQWSDPGFIKALVASLGAKFAAAFGGNPQQAEIETVQAATTANAAAMERG